MEQASADDRKIVLLGKTGTGKSSTANTILGEEVFTAGLSFNSITTECQKHEREINGKKVEIIDTPGFFDTRVPENELMSQMARCITMCSHGVHTFLILFEVGRYTIQEEEIVQKIIETFSEEAFKYTVILFTRGDLLRPKGETIESVVESQRENNDIFNTLLKKCENRYHVIDNQHWNKEDKYYSNKVQVEKLLNTIEEMVAQNGGSCYTNEMLQAASVAIDRRANNVRERSPSIPDQVIIYRAEEEVSWLIQATGFGTGALLGALLGIPMTVGAAGLRVSRILVRLLLDPRTPTAVLNTLDIAARLVPAGGPTTAGAAAVGGAIRLATTVGGTAAVFALGVAAGIVGATFGALMGLQAARNAQSSAEAVETASDAVEDAVNEIFARIAMGAARGGERYYRF